MAGESQPGASSAKSIRRIWGGKVCSRGEEIIRAGCGRVGLEVPGGVRPGNRTQSSERVMVVW